VTSGPISKQQILAELRGGGHTRPTVLAYGIWNRNVLRRQVQAEGLKPEDHSSSLHSLLVQRPQGVRFWAKGDKPGDVEVAVSDLDTLKLWAYPRLLVELAERIIVYGDEPDPALLEVMATFQPLPYEAYDGSFAAEWVYTDEVPPYHLIWK
jgi:hypothetical protein